jgi:RPA family protein
LAKNTVKREVAWRMFAKEFNSATVELPGDDQFSPTYVISPLGAKINRVYIAGVLTECENVGTEEEPLWRGRVSDPTDVFYISAGQFQPKAAQVMAELEVPALVGIVGKGRTYSPDETTTYVSVRVEIIKRITQDLRDYWNFEACQSLDYRLGCMIEALRMDPPDLQKLAALGYSKSISNGILEAINQFGTSGVQEYGQVLVNTLKELNFETSTDTSILTPDSDQTPPERVEVMNSEFKELTPESIDSPPTEDSSGDDGKDTSEKEDSENASEVQEKLVLEIITSLAEESPEGVIYEEVQARAADHGLERPAVEEYISSLIDKGIIYEPSIGVFKAV